MSELEVRGHSYRHETDADWTVVPSKASVPMAMGRTQIEPLTPLAPAQAEIAAVNLRADGWQARALSAEERVRVLSSVADDHDYAMTGLIEMVMDEDDGGPCMAETLCGHRVCDEIGCLKNKRDRARAALAARRPVGEGET